MKYSYYLLKELSGTKLTPEKLAELLTMNSFEVESIEKIGQGLEKVVIGKILEIRKHPNADKLQLAKVDIGKMKLEIVCGAPNIQVGQKVPVALVGAKLPNGLEIKKAEIRGVKSSGMLCAADELGLGKDHSGILILDKDVKVGRPFAKEMWLEDAMLEIKVLPDRSHDALSHLGMAREIGAVEGRKIDETRFEKLVLPKGKKRNLQISIRDLKLCPRYIGVLMENIAVQDSPVKYQLMLQKFGNNAINNIVDVTNAVMLELGQPLHAFDFDKIRMPVTVRRARKNEKLKLLDEQVHKLSEKDIVIADAKGPIALAGVMGGYESAVGPDTKRILLEAANFNPEMIRETRVRLNLKTDASDRFEKGIDPNLAERGAARAAEIIGLMGGKILAVNDMYPKPSKPWLVTLNLSYVEKLLGVKVPTFNIASILGGLGIAVKLKGKIMLLTIPTVRLDLKTQEDVIEEIGRIYGYEHVQPRPPLAGVQAAKPNELRSFERTFKNLLVGVGFSEVLNYSFYGLRDAEIARLDAADHFELANPMNPSQVLIRTSLLPGILKNVRDNLKFNSQIKIFESGRVFLKEGKKMPREKRMLAGALVLDGKEKKKADAFFAAKGSVQALLERIGIFDSYYAQPETISPIWHSGRVAQIKIDGCDDVIGHVGEINPQVLSQSGIERRTVVFEFDLEQLMSVAAGEREYRPISKYPTIERDVAMVAPGNVRVDDILANIQAVGGKLVLDVDLFDIYDFEDGTTSFAFHVIFGDDSRTLTSLEVDELMLKIGTSLENDLAVKLRK